MSISGPSLQGSTNPAIASHISKSGLPNRVAPPPPPPGVTATGNPQTVTISIPPVAVITPYRKVPSLVTRPLSVPDASILIAQTCKQVENQDENCEIKRQEGDKQSAVARIASFLTKKDRQGVEINETDVEAGRSNTLPRKAAKIKRESLVQLEISAPMQLHATELPANLVPVRSAPDPPMPSNIKPSQVKAAQEENSKPSKVSWAPSVPEDKVKTPNTDSRSNIRVMWTPPVGDKNDNNKELQRIGSMRETPVTIRPAIPKFGSMRAPRPKSLPPTRPSEPPPRPPLPTIPGTPESECFYDDCLNIQEGSAPIADIDEDTSPSENIYATIDDRTPDKEIPLQEVTYAPPDTVDGRKEKKSIFSFLYNKPKKKANNDKNSPDEKTTSEPVYTNLVESPPDQEVDVVSVESPQASDTSLSVSPPSSALLDSHRTSCGSSEDGGLLSEIVTELSTRDAEFVSTLAKKRNKNKGGDHGPKTSKSTEAGSLTSQDNKVNASPDTEAALHSKTSDTSTGSKKTNNSAMSKSSSYPWRSKKVPDVMRKSSASAVTSPNDDSIISNQLPKANTTDPSSNSTSFRPVPRGVFSYLNAVNTKTVTTVPSTTSVTSTVTPATFKSSSSFVNSKISQNVTTSTPTVTTTTPSTTNTPSMNLAASLAAVRAAGAAAGEAAAAATLAAGSNRSMKITDNSNINKVEPLKSSIKDRGVPAQSINVSKVTVTIPTSTVTTSANVSASVPTTTTARAAGVHKTAPSAVTTNISSIPQPSRPVFPPDKVLFPPDKVITHSSTTEKTTKMEEPVSTETSSNNSNSKESVVTSPSAGNNVARGRGTSQASKVTSPVSKPGRLLSPTRGATPTRGTTPSRNTSTTGSGRGEKSRSTTPQPGAKKTTIGTVNKVDQKVGSKPNEKSVNKTTSKAGDKTGTKPADKQIEKAGPKKPAVKSTPSISKPSTGQSGRPGSASGISGINRSGRISNSHVASLQQKFEKKESDGQEPKSVTKAPSRKSQEVKPVVAPKPK